MASPEQRRYRITLFCDGVPFPTGAKAVIDIAKEFGHRPRHKNVEFKWNGTTLTLVVENDFDYDWARVFDEFSDAVSACFAARAQLSVQGHPDLNRPV